MTVIDKNIMPEKIKWRPGFTSKFHYMEGSPCKECLIKESCTKIVFTTMKARTACEQYIKFIQKIFNNDKEEEP